MLAHSFCSHAPHKITAKMLSAKIALLLLLGLVALNTSGANAEQLHSCLGKCSDNLSYRPYTKIGEKQYYIARDLKLDWFAAAQYCRRIGGFLADIDTPVEWSILNSVLLQTYPTAPVEFWFAGNDISVEGQFNSTATGHKLPYVNWMPGQPDNLGDEDCLAMWYRYNGADYLVNDFKCTRQSLFICQLNPVQVTTIVW